MLAKRIIPCLDVKDGMTVKGVNFVNFRNAGDPVELGRAYSQAGADELVYLDITASYEERKTFIDLVRRVAENVNIDLNGCELNVTRYFIMFNGTNLVDNSEDNTGLLKVAENRRANVILPADNEQLPVYTGTGYILVRIHRFRELIDTKNGLKYTFLPSFETQAHAHLLKGTAVSGVTLAIRLEWSSNDTDATANYAFGQSHVNAVINSYNETKGTYGSAFTAQIINTGLRNAKICAVLISDTGVELIFDQNFG